MTDCAQAYTLNYTMYEAKKPTQHTNLPSACSHDPVSYYSNFSSIDPMLEQSESTTLQQKSDQVHPHFQTNIHQPNYPQQKLSFLSSHQPGGDHHPPPPNYHHDHLHQQPFPSQQLHLVYESQPKLIQADQPLQSPTLSTQPLIGSLPPQFSPTGRSELSPPFECSRIPSFISIVRPNLLRTVRQQQTQQQQRQSQNTFPPLPLQLQQLQQQQLLLQQQQSQTSSLETASYNSASIAHQQQQLSQSASQCLADHQPLQPLHPQQQQTLPQQAQFDQCHPAHQQHKQQPVLASVPNREDAGQKTSLALLDPATPPPLPLASVVEAITAACRSPESIESSEESVCSESKKVLQNANLPLLGMQLLRTRRHNSSKLNLLAGGRSRFSSMSVKNAFKNDSNCKDFDQDLDLTQDAPVAVVRRNERERNRVRQVNMGFQTLRAKIPNITKKLSKVETLRIAIKYIQYLQNMLEGRFSKKNFLAFLEDPEFIDIRPLFDCPSPCFDDLQHL